MISMIGNYLQVCLTFSAVHFCNPPEANLQPIHLIVVQGEEGLEKISKAANIYGAPLAGSSTVSNAD